MIHIKALGLEVRNMLGSGSFAQVFQCYDHRQKKEYAVKMIKKQTMTSSRVRAFFKEAEILGTMDHKNIVKFHSFHQTDQYLLIKMELIRGGTLKKLIEKRKLSRKPFKEEEVAVLMKNLLQGIRYLHNLNIIHRDLKTENILLVDDNDLSSVKIVDFGLSAKLQINHNKNIKAQCGTLVYMAPQIFNKPSYTKSVDIWSCAVIMFMLFNQGSHPFYVHGMKTEQYKIKLKTGSFPPLQYALAQNFIEKISKRQYQQRYNVNDALRHPWITRNKDDEIPLTIFQSFKGFDFTHEVTTILKLCLGIGNIVPHQRPHIDEFYLYKTRDFANNNEAVRVYSPSRKKVRDRNNELFVKMKQILTNKEAEKQQNQGYVQESNVQQCSPIVKKHQSFFTNIFQRERSCENVPNFNKRQLKMIENLSPSGRTSAIDMYSSALTERKSIIADKWMSRGQDEYLISRTSFVDRDAMLKVQNQIEESVNLIKLRNFHDNRRRIFTKRPGFQDKELLGEQKVKVNKKYSCSYETDRAEQIIKRNDAYALSGKQLYTRRPVSPLKQQHSSRPMSFSLSNRTYNSSYTTKRKNQ